MLPLAPAPARPPHHRTVAADTARTRAPEEAFAQRLDHAAEQPAPVGKPPEERALVADAAKKPLEHDDAPAVPAPTDSERTVPGPAEPEPAEPELAGPELVEPVPAESGRMPVVSVDVVSCALGDAATSQSAGDSPVRVGEPASLFPLPSAIPGVPPTASGPGMAAQGPGEAVENHSLVEQALRHALTAWMRYDEPVEPGSVARPAAHGAMPRDIAAHPQQAEGIAEAMAAVMAEGHPPSGAPATHDALVAAMRHDGMAAGFSWREPATEDDSTPAWLMDATASATMGFRDGMMAPEAPVGNEHHRRGNDSEIGALAAMPADAASVVTLPDHAAPQAPHEPAATVSPLPGVAPASTPVPSAEPTPAGEPVRIPNPVERAVVNQVQRAWRDHGPDRHLVIRLTPPELGTVRVEFRHEQGALTVALHAEDPAVRRALEQSVGHLRADLEQHGETASAVQVVVARADTPDAHAGQDRSRHERERRALDAVGRGRARGPAFVLDADPGGSVAPVAPRGAGLGLPRVDAQA